MHHRLWYVLYSKPTTFQTIANKVCRYPEDMSVGFVMGKHIHS